MNRAVFLAVLVTVLLTLTVTVNATVDGDRIRGDTVTYYTLDNADITGTTVIDKSGIVNGTEGANSVSGYSGIINEAFHFTSGTNYEYVKFGDENTPLAIGDDDMAVAAWIRDAGTTTTAVILCKEKSDAGVGIFMLYREGTDRLRFSVGGNSADYCVAYKTPYPITDTNWHFVVGVLNSTAGQCELWLDGSKIATGSVNGGAGGIYSGTPQVWSVGENVVGTGQPWVGEIDEVAVFNRSLSEDEILYLYNSGAGRQYPFSAGEEGNYSINQSTYTLLPENCTSWRESTSNTCYTFSKTPTVTFQTFMNGTCAISTTAENYTSMVQEDAARNCTVTGGTSHECTVTASDAFKWGSHPLYISCKWSNGEEDNPTSSGALSLWKNWTGMLVFAHDEQDNTTITDFTAFINGSSYSNQSTATQGWVLFENITGNYTLTVARAGYHNSTTDHEVAGSDYSYNASLHQSELTVSAYEIITNYTLTDFQVWIDGEAKGKCSSGIGCTYNVKSGNRQVKVGKVNVYGDATYFNTTTVVYAPPAGVNSTSVPLHDAELVVNASNAVTGVKVYNFTLTTTLDSPSYTDVRNTTTGELTVPLKQGHTYTVYINASQYADDTVNVTIPTGNMTVHYEFHIYSMNSFSITVKDEETRQVINWLNTSVEIAGPTSHNITTSDGTVYVDLLTPGDYRITITAPGYSQSDYYYNLLPKTHNFINLYLLNESKTQYVNFNIEDSYGKIVEGAVVQLLRYYPDADYLLVRMGMTSFDGVARIPLQAETAWYKLIILYNWTTVEVTTPKKFATTDSSFTLNVNLEGSVLQSFYAFQQIQRELTYDDSSGVFMFTWTDSSGLLDTACLKVERHAFTGITSLCDECSTATTGQLLCSINKSLEGDYIAQGILHTATKYSADVTSLEKIINTGVATIGVTGILAGVMVIGVLTLMTGLVEVAMVLTILGAVIVNFTHLILIGKVITTGLAIIAVVIMLTTRRRGAI